jgi:hypothetical protein
VGEGGVVAEPERATGRQGWFQEDSRHLAASARLMRRAAR